MSTHDNTKIRKRRPRETGTLIGVRLQPPMLVALDRMIADQPDPKPTRPEAIRQALEEHLRRYKYYL